MKMIFRFAGLIAVPLLFFAACSKDKAPETSSGASVSIPATVPPGSTSPEPTTPTTPTTSTTTTTTTTPTTPPLGQAGSIFPSNFSVLGAETVTNTGPTLVVGNLGVSPGTAVTGFPPGVVNSGVIHSANAAAANAKAQALIAYNDLNGRACTMNLTGQDLGGLTLVPGVYCFDSSAQLTGTLTLVGGADSVFVFKTASTLTTASGSSVVMSGAASDCRVFWKIGSSATLGTSTRFVGNILALASITLTTGAEVFGKALALNGAVTMDSNNVSPGSCNGSGRPPCI